MPTKMMLVISMCIPYAISFVTYTAKSLFGSNAWPSFGLLVSVSIENLNGIS